MLNKPCTHRVMYVNALAKTKFEGMFQRGEVFFPLPYGTFSKSVGFALADVGMLLYSNGGI